MSPVRPGRATRTASCELPCSKTQSSTVEACAEKREKLTPAPASVAPTGAGEPALTASCGTPSVTKPQRLVLDRQPAPATDSNPKPWSDPCPAAPDREAMNVRDQSPTVFASSL